MKNQLWWSLKGIPDESKIEWYFAIINSDKREIEAILNKIFQRLAPIEEYEDRRGVVNDMAYKLVYFISSKGLGYNGFSGIYRGEIKADKRLYRRTRTGLDGLEEYVIGKMKEQAEMLKCLWNNKS